MGEALSPLDELMWSLGAGQAEPLETQAEASVGRAAEIEAIRAHLARGRHVLISGPHGAGKGHLLRRMAYELEAETLWLSDFSAPKSLLVRLGLELHAAGHLLGYEAELDASRVNAALSRLPAGELAQLIAASLRGRGYVILIDNLESLTAAGAPALQALSEVATLLAACKTEKIDRLAAVIDRFNVVELGPMPDADIAALLWAHLERASVANPLMLERRVLAQANGVPGVAMDAVYKLAGGASLSDIRQISATQPTSARLDMTWIIVLAVTGLFAMRYIARASDSTTAYVVFGVLSVIGLMARILLLRLAR